MNRWSKQLFWVLCACFLISCAHSGESPKVSKQTAPEPAPAASIPTPAPTTAFAPAQGSAPEPVIVIPEMSHDFGELSEDKDYVYDFKIKNAGTTVLEIKKVLPG